MRVTWAGMENHYKDGNWRYPEFAQRPEIFRHIVDAVQDHDHFGVQFDPSNAIVAGADPVDFLRTVADRVVSMQASDRYLEDGHSLAEMREADGTLGYSPHLKHGVVGRGLNDYDEIFRILRAVGYDGWISIEDGLNGLEEMAKASGSSEQRSPSTPRHRTVPPTSCPPPRPRPSPTAKTGHEGPGEVRDRRR